MAGSGDDCRSGGNCCNSTSVVSLVLEVAGAAYEIDPLLWGCLVLGLGLGLVRGFVLGVGLAVGLEVPVGLGP